MQNAKPPEGFPANLREGDCNNKQDKTNIGDTQNEKG
jgi:hypothetical protein